MFLKTLTLTNFKNHADVSLRFEKKVNCFTGPNGAGKTNLLDAIYYLCISKSYFNAIDNYNIRHGQSFFRLDALIDKLNEEYKLRCIVQKGKKKEFYFDGLLYEKLSEHVGKLPVVIVTPDDSTLITGGSEERRRFLDTILSQINKEYLQHLQQYNRVLLQRNAALKQFAETNTFDRLLINTYNNGLAVHGAPIYTFRRQLVDDFVPVFSEVYREVSGDAEAVSMHYDSQLLNSALPDLLEQNEQKDVLLRRTTTGIHKDDLVFEMDDHVVKRFGSQGQQKSFLLSLKLAQYEILRKATGITPLLLLDDIFDKLDARRSQNLLQYLNRADQIGQLFITDTQKERIEGAFGTAMTDVAIFEV